MARKAMSARLAGQLGSFDFARTKAFLGFHSDLWLNLKGREPSGMVEPDDAADLRDEIANGLLELTDPRTGAPVFAAAHRRDEIYSGEAIDLAPDLILDSWSAGYRVAPARAASGEVVVPPTPLAGVDVAWSADHRPVGILVAAGPHIERGTVPELALYDVCPTALALLEQGIPAGLDGRVATEVLAPGFLASHPIRSGEQVGSRAAGGEYSAEEAAAVAAHLKDLGYIE
jgi:predicted AlkP superfamily phosphohydrolase/phosphomutase